MFADIMLGVFKDAIKAWDHETVDVYEINPQDRLTCFIRGKGANMAFSKKPDVEELAEKKDVKGLIKALGHEDKWVRRDAAKSLGKLGSNKAVEPLIEALRDDDGDLRMKAADALGEIGDARAVEPLLELLRGKRGMEPAAAKALGKIRDARAVGPLIEEVGDINMWVRLSAVEALGEIGDARAVEPLEKALGDEEKKVRNGAQEALRKIGVPQARKILAEQEAAQKRLIECPNCKGTFETTTPYSEAINARSTTPCPHCGEGLFMCNIFEHVQGFAGAELATMAMKCGFSEQDIANAKKMEGWLNRSSNPNLASDISQMRLFDENGVLIGVREYRSDVSDNWYSKRP